MKKICEYRFLNLSRKRNSASTRFPRDCRFYDPVWKRCFFPGKGAFFLDEMESFSRDCRFYSPVWMRWWVKVTSANTMSGPWTRKGKFANQTQVFEILVKFEIRLKALEENANLNIFVWIYSVMICCKLECRFWSHQCKSTNEQMAQHKQNASEYIIICTKSQKP